MLELPQTVNIRHLHYARYEMYGYRPYTERWPHRDNFLGFVKFRDECYIGHRDLDDSGIFWVPLFVGYHEDEVEGEKAAYENRNMHRPHRRVVDLDHYRPVEDLCREYPWVLMFYGNDNSSYFHRFKTREEIELWITIKVIGRQWLNVQRSLFWYNS